MPYYSLPLWNPVLSKAVLSMPWRHKGGAEVQLHLFLTLVTLPTGKNPHTLWIKGWVVPQPVWTFQRREKSHVSTGVQNPYLAACSIVTIAHSFTQTCNQHTLQSAVCIMYCTFPAVMPTVLGGTWSFFLLNLFVCLVDYISNFLYLQLTPVLSNIIS